MKSLFSSLALTLTLCCAVASATGGDSWLIKSAKCFVIVNKDVLLSYEDGMLKPRFGGDLFFARDAADNHFSSPQGYSFKGSFDIGKLAGAPFQRVDEYLKVFPGRGVIFKKSHARFLGLELRLTTRVRSPAVRRPGSPHSKEVDLEAGASADSTYIRGSADFSWGDRFENGYMHCQIEREETDFESWSTSPPNDG
jgi:hypothetical protein